MLAAVKSGDVEKLAELIRQDPGFKVNQQNEDGYTLLHHACYEDSRSPVIPLLLAHPDIDVNVKNIYGSTPFYFACNRSPSCVREMLKDSGVKVNEPDQFGCTPLWGAALRDCPNVIKWWIASGREMDLGAPGDVDKTDAIGVAKKKGKTEVRKPSSCWPSASCGPHTSPARSHSSLELASVFSFSFSFPFFFSFPMKENKNNRR